MITGWDRVDGWPLNWIESSSTKSGEDSISSINSFLFSGGWLSKIQKHCSNVIDVIFTDEKLNDLAGGFHGL